MDGNNMNKFTERTQDVKRYVFPDITKDKTTGIGFIRWIIFNDLSCMDNMFDFFNGYISRVTSSLCMFCNYVFASQQLLAYLLKHQLLYIIKVKHCQEICVCVV